MTSALAALAALSTTIALCVVAPALGLTLLRARKTHRSLAVLVLVAGAVAAAVCLRLSPRAVPPLFALASCALVVDVGVTVRRFALGVLGSRAMVAVVAGVVVAVVAGAVLFLVARGDVELAALAFALVAVVKLAALAGLVLRVEPRLAKLRGATFDVVAHMGLAIVVGIVLVVDIPLLGAQLVAVDVPTALGVAALVGACAAAVVDVLAWSPRDPAMARALTDKTLAVAPSGREKVSNVKALAWAAPSMALAFGLPLVAIEDWIATSSTRGEEPSAQALLFAQIIAPDDARVEVIEARGSVLAGDAGAARAHLGNIATSHAWCPEADRLRLDLCLDAGDLACLGAIPGRILNDDDDAHALAARGLLARDAGDRAEAARLIEAAIELTATKTGANGIVEDVALAPAAIALAELQAREKRWASSSTLLDRVVESAEAHNRPDVAFLAHADRGRVLDAAGNARDALAAYQRALQLAGVVNEPKAEAELWLDYASLLQRSQAPQKSVAACLLSAQRKAPKGSDVEKKAADAIAKLEPALIDEVKAHLDEEAARTTSFAYPPASVNE